MAAARSFPPARSLVLASLPQFCLCGGAGVMQLVSVFGIPAHRVGTPCLHCDPVAAGLEESVPVLPLPMRDDTKRTA
jgi:hypothetical protein